MTAKDVRELGYEVIWASPFEVGLTKVKFGKRKGLRTWWAKDFGEQLPGLDHPLILEAVYTHEKLEAWMENPRENPFPL